MRYAKISYDVDGILADFVKSASKRVNRPVEVVTGFYIEWLKPIYNEITNDLRFWSNLEPMIRPEQIPHYIECYITAIAPHIKETRVNWLLKNGYQNRPTYVSTEKDKLINKLGINIHVDDKLTTIISIRDNCPKCVGILHLPWYLRYNDIPEDIIVTRSVNELNQTIQRLSSEYLRK